MGWPLPAMHLLDSPTSREQALSVPSFMIFTRELLPHLSITAAVFGECIKDNVLARSLVREVLVIAGLLPIMLSAGCGGVSGRFSLAAATAFERASSLYLRGSPIRKSTPSTRLTPAPKSCVIRPFRRVNPLFSISQALFSPFRRVNPRHIRVENK